MSNESHWIYRMEAGRRRREYLGRIQENTSRFLAKYQAILERLARENLEQYVPEEFERARIGAEFIAANLETNPEAARDASMGIQQLISGLPALARVAQAEVEEKERERACREMQEREKVRSEFGAFLNELVLSLKDPAIRDFALEGIRRIQAEWADRARNHESLEAAKEAISGDFGRVKAEAEAKAREWKSRKEEETRAEAQKALLDMHREEAEKDAGQNPEAFGRVLAEIESMRERIRDGAPIAPETLRAGIEAASAMADEAVVDERCRRETVRAAIESLRISGFEVDTPRRIKDEKHDEVVVLGRKPAGQHAEFKVDLKGGFAYRFDRYEGAKCKKDIGAILLMLDEIYGVKLSDERVIWQNPDRISISERPLDSGKEEKTHGN